MRIKVLLIIILVLLCISCERVDRANRNRTEKIECIYGHQYLVRYYDTANFYSIASYIPLFNEEGKPIKCEGE